MHDLEVGDMSVLRMIGGTNNKGKQWENHIINDDIR